MPTSNAAEYATLRKAIEDTGIVGRMRTDNGMVTVDIYWMAPQVDPKLRPFVLAIPLALIRDLEGNGFHQRPPDSRWLSHGILSVRLECWAKEKIADVLDLCREIMASHVLVKADGAVAWVDGVNAT